ncbi:MAG: PH domain-containing protein [Rikenellaceae bacterium]
MSFKYKFPIDKRAKRTTFAIIFIVVAVFAFLVYYFHGYGNYLTAWFGVFALLCGLYVLISVPKYMIYKNDALEIHCLLELVIIPKENIRSVRRLHSARKRYIISVFASSGVGGYFGLFYDLVERKFVRIYARSWGDFVQIEDIKGKRYIVNCRDSRSLMDALK